MVFSNIRRSLPAVFAAAFALLAAGCLFDSGNGGPSDSLEEGHYYLAGRFDQSYAYSQYLVVLGGGRFEWVEYGYNAATSVVCRVTRKAGEYSLLDSTLKTTVSAESAPLTKCGMTREDFQALVLDAKPDPKGEGWEIRNRKAGSFEAKGLFGRAPDWKVYAKEKDPYGFYD